MRLKALKITNFGCIDDRGYEFDVDDIIVLIGPNNVGKSSILDAYEAFASVGTPRPLKDFRNEDPANHIAIVGVFVDLNAEDIETVGAKWKHTDEKYGDCIRAKWEWSAPDEKGDKFSWDPEKHEWVAGGMGGWDTLIASRIPVPLRVRPTDDAATTEAQIVVILTTAAKKAIQADEGRTSEVLGALKKLTDELAKEVEAQLSQATGRITARIGSIFPGYTVEFIPEIGEFTPEKAVGAGSYIRVRGPGEGSIPLAQQGAGLRRTFLWSALGTLADIGQVKRGKTTITADRQRILLIEEPESFLHPPMVRAAREALYALAEVPEWQVIATTHSPVFVDVSKPHTTIVRVAREGEQRTRLFSTDKAAFSNEERENLKMIRSCHATVAEFFFVDHVVLVEGETEHAVLSVLLSRRLDAAGRGMCVVNCLGKANIPLFQKILNQFGSPYTVVHDSDAPRVLRNGNWQRNSMWTINERILQALAARDPKHPTSRAVVHIPDFEQHYFGRSLASDKPYHALKVLSQPDFDTAASFERLRSMVDGILQGAHPCTYSSMADLSARVTEWAERSVPERREEWVVEQ